MSVVGIESDELVSIVGLILSRKIIYTYKNLQGVVIFGFLKNSYESKFAVVS